MKPLSIEEIKKLKSLEVCDWVWIVDLRHNIGSYHYILRVDDDFVTFVFGNKVDFSYKDYGKTWVAYKNKEQADCQGELVEFPRIIHPNELEWFVQYQYPSGIIDDEIFYSLEKAEQKLKELRNING